VTGPQRSRRFKHRQSEEDAADSGDDLAALDSLGDYQTPAFITEGGPVTDLPTFVDTPRLFRDKRAIPQVGGVVKL